VILTALLLVSQAAAPLVQGAPAVPPTALIVGTVVDASTNRPIAGAIVTLSSATPQAQQKVLTGQDGRFLFTKLAKGRYQIGAARQGYINLWASELASQSVDLADGERLSNLRIPLGRTATIAGQVVDEAGEPVIGARVYARRKQQVSAASAWEMGTPATTDDRGMYRASGLTPGDYVVSIDSMLTNVPTRVLEEYEKASSSPATRLNSPIVTEMIQTRGAMTMPGQASSRLVGGQVQTLVSPVSGGPPPMPNAVGTRFAYAPLFYPAASTIDRATVITLASGAEKTGVDLVLRPVKTIRVSGTLIGLNGPLPFTKVILWMPAGATHLATPGAVSTITDATGAFTFLSVPQGQYTLDVLKIAPQPASMNVAELFPDPTQWARIPVIAGDDDIVNLTVTMQRGLRISGRVEFAGSAPQPTPEQMMGRAIDLYSLDGRFRSERGGVRVDRKGAVVSSGVPPGKYYFGFVSSGPVWWLHSAMHNGVDLTQQPFDLSGDLEGVVIKFTDTSTELSGTVTAANGAAPGSSQVLIFPADAAIVTDGLFNPRRTIRTRISTSGRYRTFQSLPAGEYHVIAIPSANREGDTAWMTPQFLQSLVAQATRVKLVDGEKRTLDLQTVSIR
jgi:hypothetical protein